MERYYQPEIEQASREQIKAWQDERLVEQVRHVYANVPYYKKLMDERGVPPADIKSSDDLYKLPFLTKSDLRQAYIRAVAAAHDKNPNEANLAKVLMDARAAVTEVARKTQLGINGMLDAKDLAA